MPRAVVYVDAWTTAFAETLHALLRRLRATAYVALERRINFTMADLAPTCKVGRGRGSLFGTGACLTAARGQFRRHTGTLSASVCIHRGLRRAKLTRTPPSCPIGLGTTERRS